MAAEIVTLKLTLTEANQIQDSLRVHQESLMEGMKGIDRLDQLDPVNQSNSAKIGVIDGILRRHFG